MFEVLVIGLLVGASLALLGGGGTVLMTPALIYIAGFSIREAIVMSLLVVGATSLVGGVLSWRNGMVNPKAAIVFASAGILGALPGAYLSARMSEDFLLLMFGLVMLIVAGVMLTTKRIETAGDKHECRIERCVFAGSGVGMLTGFLGVGGGFVIVPALIQFGDLKLKRAIGTSLWVIAASSMAGFVTHLEGQTVQATDLFGFLSASICGLLLGGKLRLGIKTERLKQIFALFVFCTAVFVIVQGVLG